MDFASTQISDCIIYIFLNKLRNKIEVRKYVVNDSLLFQNSYQVKGALWWLNNYNIN